MAKLGFVLEAIKAYQEENLHTPREEKPFFSRQAGEVSRHQPREGDDRYAVHSYSVPAGTEASEDGVTVRVWSIHDESWVDLKTGEVVHRQVGAYYYFAAAPGVVADICVYCGADNGPHGERRDGYDCSECCAN